MNTTPTDEVPIGAAVAIAERRPSKSGDGSVPDIAGQPRVAGEILAALGLFALQHPR